MNSTTSYSRVILMPSITIAIEDYFRTLRVWLCSTYESQEFFPHNEVVRFCRTKYAGVKLI